MGLKDVQRPAKRHAPRQRTGAVVDAVRSLRAARRTQRRPRPRLLLQRPWTWGRLLWRLLAGLAAHDAPGLAAELAFRVFLAIIPGLLFVVSVFSLVALARGGPGVRLDLQQELVDNLPPDTANFIAPYLTGLLGARSANVLSAGILLSLWTVSSVITTVMKASCRFLHLPEHRSYLTQRVQALILAAFLPVLLLAGLALTWFGGEVRRLILGHVIGVSLLFPELRLTAGIFLAVLAISILLRVAAPLRLPLWLLLTGALAAVAGIWVASEIFIVYAARFVHYSSAYGLLGGALALLTWLYVCSFCLLGGLELMALLYGKRR